MKGFYTLQSLADGPWDTGVIYFFTTAARCVNAARVFGFYHYKVDGPFLSWRGK